MRRRQSPAPGLRPTLGVIVMIAALLVAYVAVAPHAAHGGLHGATATAPVTLLSAG